MELAERAEALKTRTDSALRAAGWMLPGEVKALIGEQAEMLLLLAAHVDASRGNLPLRMLPLIEGGGSHG